MKASVESPLRPTRTPPAFGLARLVRAFHCSVAGLCAAWRHEPSVRLELLLGVVLVPLAFLLPVSLDRSLMLVAALVPILVVELLNSAIEALADAVSEDYHPLIGRAKDIGSAAVLVTVLGAVVVWFAILV